MRQKMLYRIALVGLGSLLWTTGAVAEEQVRKYRNVQESNDVTMHRQSEDKSEGSGTYRNQGLTFFEDGTVATYVSMGSFNYSPRGNWHSGYMVRTYSDGSTTTGHFTGQSHKGSPPFVAEWEGTARIIDGTGRFEGATGTGAYKGGRYANGMSVTEIESKIELAGQ